jgi:hypothetical protein
VYDAWHKSTNPNVTTRLGYSPMCKCMLAPRNGLPSASREICCPFAQVLVNLIRSSRLLSPRLAGCLLLVDFPNPVYSSPRKEILELVPSTGMLLTAFLSHAIVCQRSISHYHSDRKCSSLSMTMHHRLQPPCRTPERLNPGKLWTSLTGRCRNPVSAYICWPTICTPKRSQSAEHGIIDTLC